MTIPSTIRVATWNLWWKHGPWEQRQAALATTMASVGADVVGLQEVSFRDPDQPAWLVDRLGGHVGRRAAPRAAGSTVDDEVADGDQAAAAGARIMGNAIWSRWPIIESEWRWLDVGEAPLHRTVLWARVAAPTGPLDVFTTHLSHGFHQSGLRRRQVAEVMAFIAERRRPRRRGVPAGAGR